MATITEQEFNQELENFAKHKEAGTLVWDHKFDRFSNEDLSKIKKGHADLYIVALEGGEVRIAIRQDKDPQAEAVAELDKKLNAIILQRAECC